MLSVCKPPPHQKRKSGAGIPFIPPLRANGGFHYLFIIYNCALLNLDNCKFSTWNYA